MEYLSIERCRKLLGHPQGATLTDDDVLRLRHTLYALAGVIADAYTELNDIDQTVFNPPGDALDFFAPLETIG